MHEATPERVGEPKPLTALSDLSYNIYLYHWPLYIVFSNVFSGNALASGAALLLSLALSALSFYCIEPLVRSGGKPRAARPRAVVAPVTCLLLAAVWLSATVFFYAPEISSLEAELNAGYLHQDADRFNDAPLVVSGLPSASPSVEPTAESPSPSESPTPAPTPTPILVSGVSVIGDSVCLGARTSLINNIPDCEVDAEGSRQLDAGYELMLKWQEAGTLKGTLIVALGTNRSLKYTEMLDNIVNDLAPGHRLIFVTPYDGRMTPQWISYKTVLYMRTLAEQYPFVTVADWYATIEPQSQIIGADKIHMGGNAPAIKLYTDLIVAALEESAGKPAK
ncbi:hypothetical protein FACS18949_18270 [Clostridia bacterium]|nr:hypothetical protein FACS18949_18270 [Clostridia bacterium]